MVFQFEDQIFATSRLNIASLTIMVGVKLLDICNRPAQGSGEGVT